MPNRQGIDSTGQLAKRVKGETGKRQTTTQSANVSLVSRLSSTARTGSYSTQLRGDAVLMVRLYATTGTCIYARTTTNRLVSLQVTGMTEQF